MAERVQADFAFGQATAESIALQNYREAQARLQRAQVAVAAPDWGSSGGRFNVPMGVAAGRIGLQKPVVPVQPGRPALLQYLGKWVAARTKRINAKRETIDALDSKSDLLSWLAIPHTKAFEVWGWGRLDTSATVTVLQSVSAPAKQPEKITQKQQSPNWTGKKLAERLAEIKAEYVKTGKRNWTQQLAVETNLKPREITRRIDADKDVGERLTANKK